MLYQTRIELLSYVLISVYYMLGFLNDFFPAPPDQTKKRKAKISIKRSFWDAIKKLLTMRFFRYLSNNQRLTFLLDFSIQSRTWSDRAVDQVVTEVDQERSMTRHSLGSHGLEQAQLSFHLARDTVRYTEEHKICE